CLHILTTYSHLPHIQRSPDRRRCLELACKHHSPHPVIIMIRSRSPDTTRIFSTAPEGEEEPGEEPECVEVVVQSWSKDSLQQ
ncbi:hypothetical protein KC19_7G161300, partial [Ceratodon purpureus]